MSTPARIVYDVASNFDPALIEIVHRHNANGIVSAMVGGRQALSQELSAGPLDDLASHIALCHERGLRFNYVMDRVCSSNREVFPKEHQAMLKSVDDVVACGADGLTVNSPLLCAVIRKRHPHLEIRVGAQSAISTCKHVLQWKEAGADTLTLGPRITRNFGLLKAIVELAKRLDVNLRVNANSACLPDCIYMNSHMTVLAHSEHPGRAPFLDYNLLQCTHDMVSSPTRLMGLSWIRPEDVVRYEEMCGQAAFDRFGLVLLDGWKSTAFLSRVIAAYTGRAFDGNLLDLLCLPESGHAMAVSRSGDEIRQFNSSDIARFVHIENKLLDGFIGPFVDGFLCGEKICADGREHNSADDIVCDHCRVWAAKAMSPIGAESIRWKAEGAELLESIKTSQLFRESC